MHHFLTLAVAAVCLTLTMAQYHDSDDHAPTKDVGDGYYNGPSYGGHRFSGHRFGGPYGGSHGGYGGYGYYKKCPKLDDPANGDVKITGIYPGSRAFYRCDIGHNLNGKRIRVCQRDGTWSSEAPVCDPVDCGEPDEADENGSVSFEDTTFNNTATYTCNNGYELDLTQGGKDIVICQANGEWSHTAPSCSPVDCGLPPRADPDGERSFEETTLNNVAAYTCRDGFRLEDDETVIFLTCQADGLWSESVAPDCNPITCSPLLPPADENGAVSASSSTYRSFATFTCNSGYLLDTSNGGEEVVNCQADGSWSGSAPNCVRIDCGIVLSPENGVVDIAPDSQLGSTAEYSCIRGFNLVGSEVRECLESGDWSLSAPICERIVCPTLDAPKFGKVTVSGNFVDDTAQYRCSPGFALVGNKNRVCQENGSWSGSDPECKKVYYRRPYGYGGSFKNAAHNAHDDGDY